MSTTIRDLLEELRESALDERDKGDRFERLIKAYLQTDPEWTTRFSEVWLWSEWPGRGNQPDTGIDLVAKLRDDDRFAAIQCKFYAESSTVAKGDIDSFVTASGKAEFSARYIFDTAAGWSKNAQQALEGQAIPVQRVDIGYLDEARVDWEQFSWATPELVVKSGANELRPHQAAALAAVESGLAEHDRGKLIMACGTGKTFTSLRIAERLVGAGGSVLFLVPSIQLLSQSLREWMAQSTVDVRPFAVCSDVRVGRRTAASDDAEISVIDLTEPATTDPAKLAARMAVPSGNDRMTVVFATYQSIDVVIAAQHEGVGAFDLVICDEAHRTTGLLAKGEEGSAFVRVHDASALKASKRLYMTATPRVFGEEARRRATDAEVVLADMNDETLFGPELHRLGFGDAVDAGLLTDYKVLVLAVDEDYVAENFQAAMAKGGEIELDDAARLIGCWNGLAKHFADDEHEDDPAPMRRAVAFAKNIKASRTAANSYPSLVERALEDLADEPERVDLRVQARHVDGTMGIHERNAHLAWLKDEPPEDTCRILTNARCLSEGVDVPALDAVLFLTPRGSQVDVVQSVGRVMRRSPGKKFGYIVLPIVIPAGASPEDSLRDNERYRVVWQVLQALRSHDDRFHALVNSIELNKQRPDRVIIDDVTPRGDGDGEDVPKQTAPDKLPLTYDFDGFRDAMYARIVQKVGERRYWETWAKDVAKIAQTHITRIRGLLADDAAAQAREFDRFLAGLRGNLNGSVTRDEAIEMLAQHLVTRPVFEALFADYDFTSHNPVAQAMERMLDVLDEHALDAENQTLEGFYDQVRRRVAGVDNAEGKQRILVELYDKFFATAFKKTVDKLGIVYTPIEIVDFILKSADDVLRAEFGQGLTDEGVHILDGFTGTGTFMVRLLQSGLIEPHDLARKYANELHANEILLLAYYIAAVNIETTYQELTGEAAEFPGLVLTDTFQSYEDDDRPDLDVFPKNNERIERQTKLPITVIVGNPPYSVGQDSANDDNQNERYPTLDASIEASYAARSTATSKRTLYDSYIRAIRWATLRIKDRGVIAFVTNGGWLDSNSADGMRKTLAKEFSAIHIYNLRGNQRTSGENSRREGGKIFGGGSRATVAIVVLVKNPGTTGNAAVRYSDTGDYLSREEKIERVAEIGSVMRLDAAEIEPNEHGDWLNQRRDDFVTFIPIADRKSSSVFSTSSLGIATGRDAWCYGSSDAAVAEKMRRLIGTYEAERRAGKTSTTAVRNPELVSWNRNLLADLDRARARSFDAAAVRRGAYRPFFRQSVYFSRELNGMVYRQFELFPSAGTSNVGIYVVGLGTTVPFSAIVTDAIPDLHLTGASSGGQFLARHRYEPVESLGQLDLASAHSDGAIVGGYRRLDNITDEALDHFRTGVTGDREVTKDDVFFYVYGLLHSPTYRETYAADLKRTLPRIPVVADFFGFADAGRRLSELHLGYESVDPYPLDGLDVEPVGDPYDFFGVEKMRFGKPTAEQKAAGERQDRSTVIYNERITLRGIPEEAYHYMLGSRSAIEWIIDRYRVKTDKPSGIVNDPNDWSREVGDPRYIVDLLARIVTVSLETMKIVDALPPLEIVEAKCAVPA